MRRFGFDVIQKTHLSDAWESQRRLINEVQEPVIFDVGANIGDTVLKYRKLFPLSRIHAFEPYGPTFAKLSSRVNQDEKVKLHPVAVSECNGSAPFYYNPRYHASNSLLQRPASGPIYFPKQATLNERVVVSTISIDKFCLEYEVDRIHILKMDIQGAELMALKGASNMLEAQRISLIYLEVMFVPHYEGNPLFCDILEFLSTFGYSLYGLYDLVFARDGQLRYSDAIFINEAVRKQNAAGIGGSI